MNKVRILIADFFKKEFKPLKGKLLERFVNDAMTSPEVVTYDFLFTKIKTYGVYVYDNQIVCAKSAEKMLIKLRDQCIPPVWVANRMYAINLFEWVGIPLKDVLTNK